MKRFAKGLVVGKFCPLHYGHEIVIRRALEECDQVLVLSYTKPEFPHCEPDKRAAWLAARFPSTERLVIDDALLQKHCSSRGVMPKPIPPNDAPDDDHRLFVAWICMEVFGTLVDAVFTSEAYGDGFAAALTASFTSRRPGARVTHVSVDQSRQVAPVSGTMIRSNPHEHRAFLAPDVYASFVKRACILGGESSGKTTLAKRLAHELRTSWVPEYGRELWDEKQGQLTFEDMLHIARTQIQREDKALREAHRWLICDTSPLTTLFYSKAMFKKADPALGALAERTYDCTLLCEPDFDFVQDGTRKDHDFRQTQHDWYVAQLNQRRWAFTALAGSLEQRVSAAVDVLKRAA